VKPLDRRLLTYARATTAALAAAVALGLVTAGLAIAQAFLLAGLVTDAFLGGRSLAQLAGGIALLALVLIARACVSWAQEAAAYHASASVKSTLRHLVLERAAALGPRWASETRMGEVVALVTRGLDALDAYFARYLPQLVLAVIVPVAVVASMAAADVIAALTVALTVPLIPVFMVLIGRSTEVRRRRRWRVLARLAAHFLDVVTGLPTLRAFDLSRVQLGALARATDEYRRETLATLRVAFLSAFALELGATLSVALVAVGVGLRLVAGDLDLRTGLFVLILAPEAYLPLRQLGAQFHASEEGLGAAAAAFEIIEAPPGVVGGGRAVPDLAGSRLRVEGVRVIHPGRERPAPDGISFEVWRGEVVVLTGPSGCGKSTLLQAVLGLLPTDAGAVQVVERGGATVDVAGLDGDAWRRRIAWVPQAPFMIPGTVADNVRLVAPGASDREVAAALVSVGLDADLQGSLLGEHGTGLSSGQRRRVAVARALLRDSDYLLLDEPTAGLDEASEALVLQAVRAAADRGVGVLLVAHRPGAIAMADRMVAIKPTEGTAAANSWRAPLVAV
jgi:thiol reductant ABC exporter CydD subunit